MTSNPSDEAKQITAKYKGKRWRVSDAAANLFQCGESVPIRFFENAKKLTDSLLENYEDYLQALKIVEYKDGVPKWVNKNIVPIAAVAGDADDDNESFVEGATGFLLYNGDDKTFLYANTDEWSLDNKLKNLDELGLNQNSPDAEEEADDE